MSALLSHSPTVADPSQTAGEDMDEDERDDEMPEPTRFTSAEKRKKIQTDENAYELRVPLPLLRHMRVHYDLLMEHKNSSYAFAKQARTRGKGVAMLQDVFFLSRRVTGNSSCEDDWHASKQREENFCRRRKAKDISTFHFVRPTRKLPSQRRDARDGKSR